MSESIIITPNYDNLVRQFLHDAELHANATLQHCVKVNYRGDTITDTAELSRFRNFIVSLDIAVQSCTNNESLLALRETIHRISSQFITADDKIKNAVDIEITSTIIGLGAWRIGARDLGIVDVTTDNGVSVVYTTVKNVDDVQAMVEAFRKQEGF
jgi:hypothetical protein